MEHVCRCQLCWLYKGSVSVPSPSLTYDIPNRPFQCVSVDVLSGFSVSTTGNTYLLVLIDNFSRFCGLVPVPDKSATTVARAFLENVISRHNTPNEIVLDNGSEFNNSLLHSLCSMLRIKKINVLSYRLMELRMYPYIPVGMYRRLLYDLLEQRPLPVYDDNYVKLAMRKKQDIYKIACEHLRVERDRIIRQQNKLARHKRIDVGMLVSTKLLTGLFLHLSSHPSLRVLIEFY
ncbi:uncharacterized protein LOC119584712 [Penaeus monodon]|uniref:uncharacterized protein LOC119584712 n=1 Tax=Penaeus monodon TaxID=6687 RepID=UPI0018A7BC45|nr:uncharacterized protein LOC119584712 [Penaeus monodon]